LRRFGVIIAAVFDFDQLWRLTCVCATHTPDCSLSTYLLSVYKYMAIFQQRVIRTEVR